MREQWNRAAAMQELSKSELEKLLQPAFPAAVVQHSEPAKGGLANTNIRIQLTTQRDPVLLRIYDRDPLQARKEHGIYELIKGVVPSAEVFYFAGNNPITNQPYMIMEWIDGERLEVAARSLDGRDAVEMGVAVGEALATVHGIKFELMGFFDDDLNVPEKLDMGSDGLLQFARKCLLEDIGGERLGKELTEKLLKFMTHEGKLLDSWDGQPCLTHSDFGGSNILVRRIAENGGKETWKVAAILDWEFAFSGTPFFDFGNLLRKPIGAIDGFEKSVHQGYTAYGGTLPDEWRKMSLITDLTAWLDFLTRPSAGEQLIADARRTIEETMTGWHS